MTPFTDYCTKYMEKPTDSFRPIRSFVLRQGRMTKGQQTAVMALSSLYCLSATESFGNGKQVFGDLVGSLTLEVGFGMGHSLLVMAQENPEQSFVGVEVHAPGVGRVLQQIKECNIQNLRLYQADIVPLLETVFVAETFDRVLLFFPDPWPKKRHHKRRLVQPDWIIQIARVLKRGGLFHLATDVENYAQHMQQVLEASDLFQNAYGPGQFAPSNLRPSTKFEIRGLKLGQRAWDLVYLRV